MAEMGVMGPTKRLDRLVGWRPPGGKGMRMDLYAANGRGLGLGFAAAARER